jgi:hypothetical protein
MPPPDTRIEVVEAYLMTMIALNNFQPHLSFEEACMQFNIDTATILSGYETRYLNGRQHKVPKAGSLHLAWKYLKDPMDHHRFLNML